MHSVRWTGCVAVTAVTMAVGPTSAAAQQDVWALTNARIVTVTGRTIERGTVVIRDGLIAAVGADVPPPPDARVLDYAGKTLYPGLIDLASMAGLREERDRPDAEGGLAGFLRAARDTSGWQGQDPHRIVRDELRPQDRAVSQWRNTGVTTALVAPARGMFRGQSALVNLRNDEVARMVVVSPAALHMGFEPLRGRYPSTLMGAMAYQRQSLLDAGHLAEHRRRYAAAPRGMERPVADPRTEALVPYATGQGLVVLQARSHRAIRRAVGLAREFGLEYLLSDVGEGWQALDVLTAEGRPVLVSLAFAAPDSMTGRSYLYTQSASPPPDSALQWLIDHNAAALDSAGVRFALTSGGGQVGPSEFHAAVRRAIRAGLSPETTLHALTIWPAEILGVDDRLGSIESGKIANLVVATGDLFHDTTTIDAVFVDGMRYDVEEQGRPNADRRTAQGRRRGGQGPADSAATAPAPPAERPSLPAPPRDVPVARLAAITNATILTAASGTVRNGTILIRDGKIAAVGPDVRVPRDATVHDATGRFVIPGIVDSHSHMAIEGGINEGTDNLTPQVRIKDEIEHDDIQLWHALAGGVTTIHLLHGSANSIGGQDAVIKLRWGLLPDQMLVRDAPQGIKFALGENPTRANRPNIPGMPERFPQTRMGVQYSIAEAFQRARAYAAEWDAYREDARRARRGQEPLAPKRDLFLETLAGILNGEILVHSHSYRADEILMLMHVADSFGFKVQTFQHVLEGYKVADELAAHGAGASTFADNWAYKLEAYDAIPHNAALMHERGVRVSINSDSGERVRRMLQEAAKAVKYGGVSEQDALRMVTLHPAIDVGLGDRLGSIEPGKDADLVILTHHPFDPRARVEKTLIDGIVYFDYATAPKLSDERREKPAVTTEDLGGAQ